MIRSIIICCLALLTVQALPREDHSAEVKILKQQLDIVENTLSELPSNLAALGIKSSKDVVNFVRFLGSGMEPTKAAQAEFAIQALEDPMVASYVDLTLQKLPEFGPLLHGIRAFLEGPEAKPLLDAIELVIPPTQAAVQKLTMRVTQALLEANVELLEQLIIFRSLVQTPEVKEVLQKFEALPEVTKLNEIGIAYGLDVAGTLGHLEVQLNEL